MDAREPDARCAKGCAAQCPRKEERRRTGGSQRGAWRYSSTGDRTDVATRCVAAAGNGWLELHRLRGGLVALAKEPGEPETAGYHGERDNGLTISDGGFGSARRQRGEALVEG